MSMAVMTVPSSASGVFPLCLLRERMRHAGAGKIDDEPRAVAEAAVDGDPPAVALDDQLHDVEPEAQPRDGLRGRRALERLEDLLPHRRIDSRAVVDHLEVSEVGRAIAADPHLDRFAGSVLHG